MPDQTNNRFRPLLESLDPRALPGSLAGDDSREPTTTLEGQECLVFYLGGIPDAERNDVYVVG